MLDGQYAQAIDVLQHALSAASPASLTHAYALYDLGRSLRLSGDPGDAVPVLQQRLRIPNQTDVVRHELGLALRVLGQGGGSPTSGPPRASSGGRQGRGSPTSEPPRASSGGVAPTPPHKPGHEDHGQHRGHVRHGGGD